MAAQLGDSIDFGDRRLPEPRRDMIESVTG